MARITPRPALTHQQVLSCLNRHCSACGGRLWFAYENYRTVTTLEAVVGLTLQVRRCVNPVCALYHRAYRPEMEGRLALPHHEFGLDVIAWIGACRYQAHESVPEIHRALTGRGVEIAARTVDYLLGRYDELVSVVLAAPARRAQLHQQGRLILAVDGLQPDKGHEVLWVVRGYCAAVQARYDVLLADIQDEAKPSAKLQALAAQFAKVSARYGASVFACYDVAGLPRTNNDLEQVFGGVRHQLRRATGHKSAPARLVVDGAIRLPTAVASQVHPLTTEELASADRQQWQATRARLTQRRLPRVLGRRFRQNPDAYLQALEEHSVKLSLPP